MQEKKRWSDLAILIVVTAFGGAVLFLWVRTPKVSELPLPEVPARESRADSEEVSSIEPERAPVVFVDPPADLVDRVTDKDRERLRMVFHVAEGLGISTEMLMARCERHSVRVAVGRAAAHWLAAQYTDQYKLMVQKKEMPPLAHEIEGLLGEPLDADLRGLAEEAESCIHLEHAASGQTYAEMPKMERVNAGDVTCVSALRTALIERGREIMWEALK